MHKKFFLNILLFFFLLVLVSCSSAPVIPLYEYPTDWKNPVDRENTIKEYSKYLTGRKVFLDPGHGGDDRKNKSYDGKIIEADVNLRVALNLKKYLEEAGATVFISRDTDKTVPLSERSELANKSGAGVFISIHHNAPGRTEDDYTNYTATYYHANEINYEYEPCNRDIAKFVERDLAYVMRNSGGLGSFDGTYSDYNIYPGEGFSVLRKSNIPAVLVECSFHTSRWEELRLNNEEFNQIQAWGIFRGLAKYFRASKPEIIFLPDSLRIQNNKLRAAFNLQDSTGINPKTIQVFFNKEEKDFRLDKVNSIVSVEITPITAGSFPIRVIVANKNGNHSLPYHKMIFVKGDEVSIEN